VAKFFQILEQKSNTDASRCECISISSSSHPCSYKCCRCMLTCKWDVFNDWIKKNPFSSNMSHVDQTGFSAK
jgi:hypothetical protein